MSVEDDFTQKLEDAGAIPGGSSEASGSAAPPDPTPPDTGSAAADPDTYPEAPELILGKFKSQQDLEAAYKESERRFHEISQRAAELEQNRQQQPEPAFDPGGFYADEELQRIVAQAYTSPQNAKRAYEWAVQNQNNLGFDGDRVVSELGNAWLQQDFHGAMRHFAQQQIEEAQGQYADQQSAFQLHMLEDMANAAEARAMREIPDYDKWKPLVGQWLAENPQLVQGYTGEHSVDSMTRILHLAYSAVVQQERLRQWNQQQQQDAQPEAPAPGTRTQTRSRAAKPQSEDEAIKAYKQAILNADF